MENLDKVGKEEACAMDSKRFQKLNGLEAGSRAMLNPVDNVIVEAGISGWLHNAVIEQNDLARDTALIGDGVRRLGSGADAVSSSGTISISR